MSHLKTLAARLQAKAAKPSVHPILQFGSEKGYLLQITCKAPLHLSKQLSACVIPSLKLTAAEHGLGVLTAPQIGFDTSVFVMHANLVDGQWTGYQSSDYLTYVNAQVTAKSEAEQSDWEETCNFPGLKALVSRNEFVEIEYMEESGSYTQQEFKGFPARVVQQAIEQTWGINILQFGKHRGFLEVADTTTNAELQTLLADYRRQVAGYTTMLKDRYDSDPGYKERVDAENSPEEYFLDEVADEEFEEEFLAALLAVLKPAIS